jgi:penicillin-binding protein 2
MDPKTGGVLSLVSLPSFDNNIFFEEIEDDQWEKIFNNPLNPFWNRCVSAVYPTGSTIKPLIATAALEENIIDPNRNINCQGFLEVANPWFEDQPWIFGDWTTHGLTDMRKAIAQSCNVYFYTVGGGQPGLKGLGAERIKEYLELFGWGNLTGIDLAGERKGFIPDSEWKKQKFESETEKIWLPGDTYNLSIGQGYLQVSPLQVANSFVALANNGKLFEPHLIKAIVDENKNIIEEIPLEVVRQDFVDPTSLKIVRQGMREAVVYGSSVRLNSLPVTSAAKTGTAQTSRPNFYHNWITVFAPYEDPEIVLTVMIENVPEEQVAALPVAQEILNWYFSR